MLWSYELPPDRIASHPLPDRHNARLLIYRDGIITEDIFLHLAEHLPAGTRLLYNDSRVVPARLRQGRHEVLLTEIIEGSWYGQSPQRWKGLFRPGRFWRRGGEIIMEKAPYVLQLRWQSEADERQGIFLARWTPASATALEVIEALGEPPLPPYLHREVEPEDRSRYQTFYARQPGSVAAPTAGLHFTPAVWEKLHQRGIPAYPLTLHVGIGTFLPLRTPDAPEKHPMHAERFFISEETLNALRRGDGPILCVGTTSLRVVESLYWLGLLYARGETPQELPPLAWRALAADLSPSEALSALPARVEGSTALYILPGYPFMLTNALITNFHLPGSTLIALVQAFIGEAGIRTVYTYALERSFRFLSYGDTSLLWRA